MVSVKIRSIRVSIGQTSALSIPVAKNNFGFVYSLSTIGILEGNFWAKGFYAFSPIIAICVRRGVPKPRGEAVATLCIAMKNENVKCKIKLRSW